jgi:hypothetical protein
LESEIPNRQTKQKKQAKNVSAHAKLNKNFPVFVFQ